MFRNHENCIKRLRIHAYVNQTRFDERANYAKVKSLIEAKDGSFRFKMRDEARRGEARNGWSSSDVPVKWTIGT